MARLVAAFGSSHSTMLFSSLENWQGLFDHVDCKAPISDFDGTRRSFDELLMATPPTEVEKISKNAIVQRHQIANAAMDRLEADLTAAELEVLIIIGDDQREIFQVFLPPGDRHLLRRDNP